MSKGTWIVTSILLCATTAFAQNPCTRSLSDQERIARAEIQARIDERIEANEAKDLTAKMDHLAPDFTLKLPDGTVLDRKQVEADLKRDGDWILAVSDQTANQITCLELKGKEAVLITDQHFVRTVPDRKDGSPHELITNVTHRETWVYGDHGWLTKQVEELKQGPMYLDGKLFESRVLVDRRDGRLSYFENGGTSLLAGLAGRIFS